MLSSIKLCGSRLERVACGENRTRNGTSMEREAKDRTCTQRIDQRSPQLPMPNVSKKYVCDTAKQRDEKILPGWTCCSQSCLPASRSRRHPVSGCTLTSWGPSPWSRTRSSSWQHQRLGQILTGAEGARGDRNRNLWQPAFPAICWQAESSCCRASATERICNPKPIVMRDITF